MAFLAENMTTFLAFGSIVVALVLGLGLAPFLKMKGWIKQEDLSFTNQILKMIELALADLEFKNKDKALLTIDVINISTQYVAQMMSDKTVEEKRGAAKVVAFSLLDKLGVAVNENKRDLINTSIDVLIK